MYSLIITPTNPNANGPFFNGWVIDNYQVSSIEHNELEIIVWFANDPSQEIKDAITNKYNSLTSLDVLVSDFVLEEERLKLVREEYGKEIYNRVASMSRLNRMSMNPIPPHEQYRKDYTDPFNDIISCVLKGDFKTAYEKINEFVLNEFIVIETIITYRLLVAHYITSTNIAYTDIFGMRVKGGTYFEYSGETVDDLGFINNYSI